MDYRFSLGDFRTGTAKEPIHDYEVNFIYSLDLKYHGVTVQAKDYKDAISVATQFLDKTYNHSDFQLISVKDLITNKLYAYDGYENFTIS